MKRYGYFLDLLKLDIEKYPVIAVVGGGGKTSLIYRLNEELQASGKKSDYFHNYPYRHMIPCCLW